MSLDVRRGSALGGESKRDMGNPSRAAQLRADFNMNGRHMSNLMQAPAAEPGKTGAYEQKTSESETNFDKITDNRLAEARMNSFEQRRHETRTLDKLAHGKTVSARIAVRWCLDRDAQVCFGCREEFSTFLRKHHCRACGGVYCHSCSRWQKKLPLMGYDEPVRVCGFCFHEDQKSPPSSIGSDDGDEDEKNETDSAADGRENVVDQNLRVKHESRSPRRPLSSIDSNGRKAATAERTMKKRGRRRRRRRKPKESTSFDLSSKALVQLNASAQQQQLQNNAKGGAQAPSFCAFSQVAPVWVDDSDSDICQQCSIEFGIIFARRHHCRGCGGLFCWTCTQRRLALPHYGYVSPVRVCVSCSSPQILSTTLVPTGGGRIEITGRNLSNLDSSSESIHGSSGSIPPERDGTGMDRSPDHAESHPGTSSHNIISVEVQLNGHSTVQCTDIEVLVPGEKISCVVPPGAGGNKPFRVTVNGLAGVSTFSYAGPEVIKTSAVSTSGGELVVTGVNFGSDPDLILVQWYSRVDRSWHACERVELLAAHTILRCLVGPGVGSTAMLNLTVAGASTRATYAHAPPVILDVTPVSAGGGVIEIVGLNFGPGIEALENALHGMEVEESELESGSSSAVLNQENSSRIITVEIDGVQCQGVQMITPHTKIRCLAPRISRLQQFAIGDEEASELRIESSVTRNRVARRLGQRRPRRPHLTPPQVKDSSRSERNTNGRQRSNSGDELRLLVVRVGDLFARSEVTYIDEIQADAFKSSRDIEEKQKYGRRGRGARARPASTPPRGRGAEGGNNYVFGLNEKAPWMPDENVLECMLRCGTKFSFFTRKHHCRNCGIVVCAGCSKHNQYIEAYRSVQRVCRRCFRAAATREHREAQLRHRLEHIATMQSIEAGKKARLERDLAIVRLQGGSSGSSSEEIVRLEALIAEQDRRIAGKQNEFNRIQQRMLNLTVNGLEDTSTPSRDKSSRNQSPAARSISGSSSSPSFFSSSSRASTPLKNLNNHDTLNKTHHVGFSNSRSHSLVRPNSVTVMADRHVMTSSSQKSERPIQLSPSPSSDDRTSRFSRASSFSNIPPSGLLQPIPSPGRVGGGNRGGAMKETLGVEADGSPPYLVGEAQSAKMHPGADDSPRTTEELRIDLARNPISLDGSSSSSSSSSVNVEIPGSSNKISITAQTESLTDLPPMSPPDSEGRALLASGLLRGRTISEYAVCTFAASPERSWVGASRNIGNHRRVSSGSINRGRSSDLDSQISVRKRASSDISESPHLSSSTTRRARTGLAAWVSQRLGAFNAGSSKKAYSSVESSSQKKNTRNSSSMLVAVHRGNKCVLKELSMGDQETRQRIEREVAIRGMLTEPVHPNIAPLEAIFYERDIGKMYIHYGLVEVGNLADWLAAGEPQPWDIQSVFQQLAGTLVYLHQHQIVHRTLSLDSVLIGIQGDAHGELPKPYVTDFGDALIVPRNNAPPMSASGDIGESKVSDATAASLPASAALIGGSGDPTYRAPEVSAGSVATPASDMWALGVMMYKATFGLELEPAGLGGVSVPIPPHPNARLRNLIKSLLSIDPQSRITAIGAVVHPYFTMSLAAEMHQAGNVIDPEEKLSLFRRHLETMRLESGSGENEAIQFIRVRRESVVRDVLRDFARFGRANLEKRLIVMYEGESGVDAGGLTKDMFHQFFEQLISPAIGIFTCTDEGSGGSGGGAVGGGFVESGERTYLPSSTCELIGYLEALGKVLAKVVLDGHTVDARFAPAFYKYILSNEDGGGEKSISSSNGNGGNDVNGYNSIGFADLEAFDGQLYAQLHDNVLQRDITSEYSEMLALDFDGLVPKGSQRIVTNANKREYVKLRARHILVDSRRRQLEAIRKGFHTLDWRDGLKRFNALDFRKLLCGPEILTANLVIENIDFTHGNWRGSNTLKHVKRFLHDCEAGRISSSTKGRPVGGGSRGSSELRRFLRFVTGSPNLPYGGLASGSSNTGQTSGSAASKICFNPLAKSERLPEAHTCFNTVDLPDYNDYEMLRDKLMQSIGNDDGKFDII